MKTLWAEESDRPWITIRTDRASSSTLVLPTTGNRNCAESISTTTIAVKINKFRRETSFAIDLLCDQIEPSRDKNNYDKAQINIRSFMQFGDLRFKPAWLPRYLLLSFCFCCRRLAALFETFSLSQTPTTHGEKSDDSGRKYFSRKLCHFSVCLTRGMF